MDRRAVSLSDDELIAITSERTANALITLVGQDAVRSETATLHALILLGLEKVNDHIQAEGYAALAATMTDEDRAFSATVRGRRHDGDPKKV